MDLRRRFALAEAALDAKSRILLVEIGPDEHAGVLVDEVLSVYFASPIPRSSPPACSEASSPRTSSASGGRRSAKSLVLVLLDLKGAIAS